MASTFTAPGSHAYYRAIHPNMKATVTVTFYPAPLRWHRYFQG
jgi:hypothetical protein